MTETKEQWIGK